MRHRLSDNLSSRAVDSYCVAYRAEKRVEEIFKVGERGAGAIGARYGQWAVFRITAQEQTVLGCFGPWSRSRRF
jgi:hypothetical protein